MARTGSNTFRAQHVLGAVTTFAISTAVLGLARPVHRWLPRSLSVLI